MIHLIVLNPATKFQWLQDNWDDAERVWKGRDSIQALVRQL